MPVWEKMAVLLACLAILLHASHASSPLPLEDLDGRALIEDDESIAAIVEALGEASAPPLDGEGREPPNSEHWLPGARPSEPSSQAGL